jgi:hypothetical protein
MSKLAEESMRRVLNTRPDEPPIEISPAADAAMRKLVEVVNAVQRFLARVTNPNAGSKKKKRDQRD